MVTAVPVVMPMFMIVRMIMHMPIPMIMMGMTMPAHRTRLQPARRVQA